MVNLNTKSGENNCYFNITGRCTNPKVTRDKATAIGGSGRDWDSKQNCTFTQDGAQSLCHEYFFEHIYKETALQEAKKQKTIIVSKREWIDFLEGRTNTLRAYDTNELHHEFGDYSDEHIMHVNISETTGDKP